MPDPTTLRVMAMKLRRPGRRRRRPLTRRIRRLRARGRQRIRQRLRLMPAPLRGALLMLVATAFFAVMTNIIRHVSVDQHPFEIVFFRNLFALVFMLPWLIRSGPKALRTRRVGLYSLRGGVTLVGMLTGFYAVTIMPLADVVALSFTAPIFATLGAALILHETVRLRRWSAIIVGFAGALLILRPGVEALTVGAVLVLISAACQASNTLVIKVLARTESVRAIVAYMAIFLTPLSLLPALLVWQTPSIPELLWLLALAGCGTFGHLAMTQAFAVADTSAVLPFDFARLPFTALIAYLAFAQVPDIWVWAGAGVIFASSIYIAHREAQLARRARREEKLFSERLAKD